MFKKANTEEDVIRSEPIEELDSFIKWGFQALKEKDFKTALGMFKKTGENSNKSIQQLGEGLTEIAEFYKDLQEGRELKAPMKAIDSLTLIPELEDLIPISKEDLECLHEDISQGGLIAPLLCVQDKDKLFLLDGYTRYKLAKELGKKRVPVVVISTSLDPIEFSIKVNTCRRHLSPEQRMEIIRKLPRAKSGRPKKGSTSVEGFTKEKGSTSVEGFTKEKGSTSVEGFTKEKVASMLGVSDRTVERDISRAKGNGPKAHKTKEKASQEWLSSRAIDMFGEEDSIQSQTFMRDFPPTEECLDTIHKEMDKAIRDILDWLQKKGLQDKVGTFRVNWSFEIRKKRK